MRLPIVPLTAAGQAQVGQALRDSGLLRLSRPPIPCLPMPHSHGRTRPCAETSNVNLSPAASPVRLRTLALAALAGLRWPAARRSTACSRATRSTTAPQRAKTKPLEVPPDLTQLARDSRYQPQGGVVSAVGRGRRRRRRPRPRRPWRRRPWPLNASGDMRIERQGKQRWLVASQTPEQLWPQVRAFWEEQRLHARRRTTPQAGVMETDWAENRAKLPQDIIRNTARPLLDTLYATGERDRFRTRVERTRQRQRDLHLPPRHRRGLHRRPREGRTVWRAAAHDPQLEAEFLARLMVALGAKEEVASAAVAQCRRHRTPRAARACVGRAQPGTPRWKSTSLRPRLAPRRPGAGPQRLHGRRPRPRGRPVLRALRRPEDGRQGRAGLLRAAVRRQHRHQRRCAALPRGAEGRRREDHGVGADLAAARPMPAKTASASSRCWPTT